MSLYLEIVTAHSTLLSILGYIGQNWDNLLFLSVIEMLRANFHSLVLNFDSDLSSMCETWTAVWGSRGIILMCLHSRAHAR